METEPQQNSNRSPFQKAKKWFLNHKIAASIIAIIVLLIAGGVVSQFSLTGRHRIDYQEGPTMEMKAPGAYKGGSGGAAPTAKDSAAQRETEVEVTKGDIDINSDDAKEDEKEVRSITEDYGGYVEESRQNETDTRLRMSVTSRVPSDEFEDFFLKMRDSFDIESYNVRNYRIKIEREVDEKEIFSQTMDEYSDIREEIQGMSTGEKKIDLLMKLTDTELELSRKEKQFAREISQAQKRGDLATVKITLEEKLPADLIPEDIGSNFREDLADAFEEIVEMLTSIVTQGLVLFVGVIKFIIYALIVIIPLWFVLKIYKKYSQN